MKNETTTEKTYTFEVYFKVKGGVEKASYEVPVGKATKEATKLRNKKATFSVWESDANGILTEVRI
jgi:hypothetical protein